MAKYDAEKFDSTLNTFREIYSNPAVDKYQGTVILPLDFSLEMDGVSGIIPNSAFEIPTNSLPSSYLVRTGDNKGKSKIAFILHSIDHNFGDNKWTTKITGQTLNIRFDELTDAQKKAIEDFKEDLEHSKPEPQIDLFETFNYKNWFKSLATIYLTKIRNFILINVKAIKIFMNLKN